MLVSCLLTLALAAWSTSASRSQQQIRLGVSPQQHPASAHNNSSISAALFADLEELARVVDISYCVGSVGLGIQEPFQCPSRCGDFPSFELVTVREIYIP